MVSNLPCTSLVCSQCSSIFSQVRLRCYPSSKSSVVVLWPTTISPILFGHLLRVPCKGKDLKELLSNICAVGAPSTSAAAAKEEEKEESEEDMLSAYLSRSVSCSF